MFQKDNFSSLYERGRKHEYPTATQKVQLLTMFAKRDNAVCETTFARGLYRMVGLITDLWASPWNWLRTFKFRRPKSQKIFPMNRKD